MDYKIELFVVELKRLMFIQWEVLMDWVHFQFAMKTQAKLQDLLIKIEMAL